MKGIDQIRRHNPKLAEKIEAQHGFIMPEDIVPLTYVNRSMLVLVRCNSGRFLTPVETVEHFKGIIERHASMAEALTGKLVNPGCDYVRDISLPANVVLTGEA